MAAAPLQRLDLLADPARLLGPVPDADHRDLLAFALLGPQSLAEPPAIMSDEAASRGEDVRRGAVILLKPDDLGAREILLEAQDVRHLGAAPGIDRLVVVADAADVLPLLGEQPQPEILALVGVLIFVDEYVLEAVLIELQHLAVGPQDHQHVEQQVAEIAGVECLEPRLVAGVEFGALAVGICLALGGIDLRRVPAAVLPAADQPAQKPRGP